MIACRRLQECFKGCVVLSCAQPSHLLVLGSGDHHQRPYCNVLDIMTSLWPREDIAMLWVTSHVLVKTLRMHVSKNLTVYI